MPEQLGHYNLLERVGVGGLGEVFRARDTVKGRTVLVKHVADRLGGDPLTRSRFLRDTRAAVAISHPNVATLFEVGEHGDQLFLVFEFVAGETLDQLHRKQALDVRRAIDLGIQLAEALGAAHTQGVWHLDVRPANVRVNLRGHAKLLNTGLSAWTTGGRAGRAGSSQDPTDPYRSPEQRRGQPADHRSDLFSLGAILFELLAGRPPSDGASPGRAATTRPREVNTEVPVELDAIVARALADRVEDRYQSAVSLAAELRSVAAILDIRCGHREPPSFVSTTPDPPGQSSRWPILLAGTLAMAILLWLWLG
jgi:serine/threonine-protein kinase